MSLTQMGEIEMTFLNEFQGNSYRHNLILLSLQPTQYAGTAVGRNLSLKSCPLTSQSVIAITVTVL